MGGYHDYLYDLENNRIIGDYEKAYANCGDVHPCQHELDTPKHFLTAGYLEALGPEARILDVGCGYGDFVDRLTQRGLDVVGCDVSPTAVKKGLEKFPLCRLEAADVCHGLPYEDDSFDVVILFGVMWFMLDRLDHSLSELKRVLKHGGWLFCSLGFPQNQKLGLDVISGPEDLRRILSARFNIREFLTVFNPRQLGEGSELDACDLDAVVIARKDA